MMLIKYMEIDEQGTLSDRVQVFGVPNWPDGRIVAEAAKGVQDALAAGAETETIPYVAPPEPDPAAIAISTLQGRDQSGEDLRAIEDIADAVLALGGTLPQPVLDRIAARRDLRSEAIQ